MRSLSMLISSLCVLLCGLLFVLPASAELVNTVDVVSYEYEDSVVVPDEGISDSISVDVNSDENTNTNTARPETNTNAAKPDENTNTNTSVDDNTNTNTLVPPVITGDPVDRFDNVNWSVADDVVSTRPEVFSKELVRLGDLLIPVGIILAISIVSISIVVVRRIKQD